MYKEIWIEEETAAGLSFLSKRQVKSRKRKSIDIDVAACIDKAVTAAMYGWSVVLSVAVAAVLVRIWF